MMDAFRIKTRPASAGLFYDAKHTLVVNCLMVNAY